MHNFRHAQGRDQAAAEEAHGSSRDKPSSTAPQNGTPQDDPETEADHLYDV
jgi:hypothetical protein